jgi:hypothetical protein
MELDKAHGQTPLTEPRTDSSRTRPPGTMFSPSSIGRFNSAVNNYLVVKRSTICTLELRADLSVLTGRHHIEVGHIHD